VGIVMGPVLAGFICATCSYAILQVKKAKLPDYLTYLFHKKLILTFSSTLREITKLFCLLFSDSQA